VVVVADSSKWGVVSNYEIGAIDQAHVLVSDESLPSEAAAGLGGRGLRVVRASADLDPSATLRQPTGSAREDPNGHH
jgi:hypothetical protein